MKKNTSWKFTDESSVTFQLSVSGPGEFGPSLYASCLVVFNYTSDCTLMLRAEVLKNSSLERGKFLMVIFFK